MPTAAPSVADTDADTADVIDWMTDPGAVAVLDGGSPAKIQTRQIAGCYNLPALPHNGGSKVDARQLLDRLTTAERVAGS